MGTRTLTLNRPAPKSDGIIPIKDNPFVTVTGGVQRYTNRCYVLIGPSGSGKSTWCDSILKNTYGRGAPAVICEDDLVEEECVRTGESFDEVVARSDSLEHTRVMMECFHRAIGVSRDIIIDRPNLTEDDRSDLLLLLPDSYQKIGIVFTTPRNVLFARLEKRLADTGRTFSRLGVQNMISRFERPGLNEFYRTTTIDPMCQYMSRKDVVTISQ